MKDHISKKGFVLLLLVVFVIFASFQGALAYTNSAYGFNLTPPAGWTTTENQLGVIVIFQESGGSSNINVVVRNSGGLTLRELVPSLATSLPDQLKNTAGISNYNLISQGYHTYGSIESYEFVQTFTYSQTNFKNKQVLFVGGDQGYIVTCTAYASNYDSYVTIFDNCLASFTTTSPTPTITPSASPTPTITPSASPTPTPTITPSASPTPTITPTPTATISPTNPVLTTTPTPSVPEFSTILFVIALSIAVSVALVVTLRKRR